MAIIAQNNTAVLGPFSITETTLTASDSLSYTAGQGQLLKLRNTTGSPVVVTIDGADGTTVAVPGAGAATFSVAAGLAITVPANGTQAVKLDTIALYLKGAVAVTGGTGVVAHILY